MPGLSAMRGRPDRAANTGFRATRDQPATVAIFAGMAKPLGTARAGVKADRRRTLNPG